MTDYATLGEVCLVTDGTHYTPPDGGGPFPFLTVKDMSDTGILFNSCSHISQVEFSKAQNAGACPRRGDVLFSKDGTVGKVHVVEENREFAVLSSIAILRPDTTRISSRYLGYALKAPEILGDASNRKTGSALQRIILSDLKKVRLPLPSLAIQNAITETLDYASTLCRTRRYALQLCDEFLPAAFLEMFGDPIRNTKGWDTIELEDVARIERGKFTPRPRNDPTYYGGRHPFIQTGDISQSGGYLRNWSQTLNDKGTAISRSFPPGTIVIAIVGATIGMTAVLEIDVYCPDSVVGIQVDSSRATKEYVHSLLKTWRPIFLAQAPETARANINLDTLRPLRAPLPPLTLQQEFSQLESNHRRLRTANIEALRQADHLFQSLLHRAFNGDL